MSDPIDNAAERATAAIKALADAGHRQANEHAFAVDRLRAEVESLRVQNAHLRAENERLEAKASFYRARGGWQREFHGVKDAPADAVLAVHPIDTDAT